ncbi:MAG: hypothetical protein JWN99_1738 [Ilumatobacteraceae bacterium]|nr:hypothetical protein [Ilumatobacteraceae bacterium]
MKASAQWREDPLAPGPCVLVDIDGVLSDASGRQHHLKNPEGRRDWRGFFGAVGEDQPLTAVPALLGLLDPSLAVVLLSARPSWVFQLTVDWLFRHTMRWDLLILRAEGDTSDSADFKRGVLRELRDMGWEVALAIDDDQRIVQMYTSEQQPALYVHSGYYASPATT